ncbi:MAG: helix-turn-helix transcriptional regulator [Verrucomicrobiae bacterium]|nr:helix-turn-helix transcriptional regulator [Verrucomicrobiae bacterium]
MNLSELHKRLSHKPTYRKAYDAIGDVVLIGAAVRKLREDEEITQRQLVEKIGISQFYLSRLETGSGKVSADVVAAVVRHFEEPLRELGINVEPWLAVKPSKSDLREIPSPHPRPIIPESMSRTRRPAAAEEKPEEALREKPDHKYGTPH